MPRNTVATAKTSAAQSAAEAKRAALSAKLAAAKAKAASASRRGNGFVIFIREQGVIGLAVGLAIGTAAGDTVKKLVQGFITPIVQFVVGSQSGLENATWHVHLWGRTADFQWGAFVSSAITLLAVAFVVYFIVKGLRLDKLDRAKDDA